MVYYHHAKSSVDLRIQLLPYPITSLWFSLRSLENIFFLAGSFPPGRNLRALAVRATTEGRSDTYPAVTHLRSHQSIKLIILFGWNNLRILCVVAGESTSLIHLYGIPGCHHRHHRTALHRRRCCAGITTCAAISDFPSTRRTVKRTLEKGRTYILGLNLWILMFILLKYTFKDGYSSLKMAPNFFIFYFLLIL